jgi:hypothetical protein
LTRRNQTHAPQQFSPLLDYLIGERKQRRRHVQAERLGGLKVDDQLVLGEVPRRPGRSASNDPGLAAVLSAEADAMCFVAKSWDYHVRVALVEAVTFLRT